MPFKSEAQRRYLWANEPEIARDWTDTYGSKIHAANGGIMRLPFSEGKSPNWAAEQILNKKQQELQNLKNLKAEQQGMKMDTTAIDKAIQSLETFIEEGSQDEKGIGSKVLEFIFGSAAEGSELTFAEREKLIEEANAMGDGSEISSNRPYGIDSSMVDTGKMEDAIRYNRQQNAMQKMMNAGIGNLPNDFNRNYRFSAENWRNKLGNMKSNIGKGITSAWGALTGNPLFSLGAQAFRGQQLTPQQIQMNKNFMGNYGVTRNPTTGRMIGGPFQGMNAPGQSAYGSATSQDMAQNWMNKYGKMDYQTEKQMAKQKTIRDIAAGNTNLPPSERRGPTPQGPTPAQMNMGSGNRGQHTTQGRDRGRSRGSGDTGQISGGHHFFRGGIAGIWPR